MPVNLTLRACSHGNDLLFIFASCVPSGCQDTVWRMRKVFSHSPKKVQAISPQIEKKGKAEEEEVCNVSYRRRSRNTKLGLGIDMFLMSRGIVELL